MERSVQRAPLYPAAADVNNQTPALRVRTHTQRVDNVPQTFDGHAGATHGADLLDHDEHPDVRRRVESRDPRARRRAQRRPENALLGEIAQLSRRQPRQF